MLERRVQEAARQARVGHSVAERDYAIEIVDLPRRCDPAVPAADAQVSAVSRTWRAGRAERSKALAPTVERRVEAELRGAALPGFAGES